MATTAQLNRQQSRHRDGRYSEMARGEADPYLGMGVSTDTADHSVACPGLTYAVGPVDVAYRLALGEPVTADEVAERGSWAGVTIAANGSSFTVPSFIHARQTSRPQYGVGYDGSKYDGRYRPVSEIAKDIRSDIKAAVAVGWIPDNLRYRVVCRSSQSINVLVVGLSDEDREDPSKVADPGAWRTDRDEVIELEKRLTNLMRAYNSSRSDAMTDYADEAFYSTVNIETDHARKWREEEAQRRKATRDVAAARRSHWEAMGRSVPTPNQEKVISALEAGPLTASGVYAAAGQRIRSWAAVGELTRGLVDGGHATFAASSHPPRNLLERKAVDYLTENPTTTMAALYAHLGMSQRGGDRMLCAISGLNGPLRLAAR